MRERTRKEPAVAGIIIKAMLVSYILTALLLLLLAMLVFKLNMKASSVEVGILIIYIAAAFAGGFLAGKMGKNKRFLWGLGIGTAYVAVLVVVSLCMNGGIDNGVGGCAVRFVMCMGAGMLGGMLS